MRPVPDKTSCRGSILLNLCCAPWISGRSLPRSANWRRCYSRIWRGRRNWLALKIRSGPGCCSSFLRRDASEIEQADGTAEKFIGDAVMAAFGGPRHSRTTPSVHPTPDWICSIGSANCLAIGLRFGSESTQAMSSLVAPGRAVRLWPVKPAYVEPFAIRARGAVREDLRFSGSGCELHRGDGSQLACGRDAQALLTSATARIFTEMKINLVGLQDCATTDLTQRGGYPSPASADGALRERGDTVSSPADWQKDWTSCWPMTSCSIHRSSVPPSLARPWRRCTWTLRSWRALLLTPRLSLLREQKAAVTRFNRRISSKSNQRYGSHAENSVLSSSAGYFFTVSSRWFSAPQIGHRNVSG